MENESHRLSEVAGQLLGAAMAPLVAAGSFFRQARLLHPEGVCHGATVAALTTDPALAPLAQRLSGPALVRLSSALWRGGELPDVLGCAVRFGVATPIATAAPVDAQDLLFATSSRVWTLPLAFFVTNQHDFLDNAYYGIAPFELAEGGLVRLALIPQPGAPSPGPSRPERLDHSVAAGRAVFVLKVQRLPNQKDWRSDRQKDWTPLVEVRLGQRLSLDQAALRFSPFQNGRGIRPRGFIHSIRRAVYTFSQLARPKV